MISNNFNRGGRVFELGTLFFKGLNDDYKFLVIDLVIIFCRAIFLGEIGDRV